MQGRSQVYLRERSYNFRAAKLLQVMLLRQGETLVCAAESNRSGVKDEVPHPKPGSSFLVRTRLINYFAKISVRNFKLTNFLQKICYVGQQHSNLGDVIVQVDEQ